MDVDGFRDVVVESHLDEILRVLGKGMRRQGDHGEAAERFVPADFCDALRAVHHGHLDIQEEEVEGPSRVAGGEKHVERVTPVHRYFVSHILRLQEPYHELAVEVVVLGHQDPEGAHGRVGLRDIAGERVHFFPGPAGTHFLQWQGDGERASPAHFALERDGTAHLFGEAFHDGQSQAGSAMLTRGRVVHLVEGRKHRVALVAGNPDAGVGHAEGDHAAVEGVFQRDAAAFGELEGVVHQVGDDLLGAVLVAQDKGRHVRAGRDGEDQVFLPDAERELLADFIAKVVEGELRRVKGHFARLDARNVEDVVNGCEEDLAGLADDGELFPRRRVLFLGQEDLREAHDCVERRPDIVAHVRQEGGLGAVGRLGDAQEIVSGVRDRGEIGKEIAGIPEHEDPSGDWRKRGVYLRVLEHDDAYRGNERGPDDLEGKTPFGEKHYHGHYEIIVQKAGIFPEGQEAVGCVICDRAGPNKDARVEPAPPVKHEAQRVEGDAQDVVVQCDGVAHEVKNRYEYRVPGEAKEIYIAAEYEKPVLFRGDDVGQFLDIGTHMLPVLKISCC